MKRRIIVDYNLITINEDNSVIVEQGCSPYTLCERIFLIKETGTYVFNNEELSCEQGDMILMHEPQVDYNDKVKVVPVIVKNNELFELLNKRK